MNEDSIKGSWKQLRGKIQRKWGELTDDELDKVEGSSDELVGLIQKKYGQSKDQIEDDLKKLDK